MKEVALLITIDGLGDRPSKKRRTPLESASSPNLDFLAREGRCGLVSVAGKGIAPESDVALIALLGYDPKKHYTGRGPLEAYGLGIKMKEGDLVLRTNFATVDNSGKIIDRRAGRNLTTKEAQKLAQELNKKVKLSHPFLFQYETEHRAMLVIRDEFSSNISNTDPAYERMGLGGVVSKKVSSRIQKSHPLDSFPKSKKAAEAVNSFVEQAKEALKESEINKKRKRERFLPANAILTRDAGIKLPDFPKETGKWAAVVGYTLEIGLAKQTGMKIFKIEYPDIKSRDIYKTLYQKLDIEIKTALKVLKKEMKKFDHFWIHFKPVDIPGHDGRFKDKKKMIEILDKKFFKAIVALLKKDKKLKVAITADHATPVSKKLHSSDPVPILIYDGLHKDKVKEFSERSCRKGSIGHIMGKDVIKLIKP